MSRWPKAPGWTGFRDKTLWDFLQVLGVPLALLLIGAMFSFMQQSASERNEDRRAEVSFTVEADRANAANTVEAGRAEVEFTVEAGRAEAALEVEGKSRRP